MTPAAIQAMRKASGLSQPAFALAYGIPLDTLRSWEQGIKSPTAAALTLLRAIDRDPDTMRKLIA